MSKFLYKLQVWIVYFITSTMCLAAVAELLLRSFLVVQSGVIAVLSPTVWPWLLTIGAFIAFWYFSKWTSKMEGLTSPPKALSNKTK